MAEITVGSEVEKKGPGYGVYQGTVESIRAEELEAQIKEWAIQMQALAPLTTDCVRTLCTELTKSFTISRRS